MKNLIKKVFSKMKILKVAKNIKIAFLIFSSKSKWKLLERSDRIFLELGSGAKMGANGWTTVDLQGADILHDLRNGIPLPDNSVNRIYTSHMFEHIPYKSLVLFLKECSRVLKVGGELSVCVPNSGLYIKSYLEKRQFKAEVGRYEPALVDTGSFLDQVNYICYMDGLHHYMFDEENLINTIKKAPFSTVNLRKYDPEVDLESRDFESVYATAVK